MSHGATVFLFTSSLFLGMLLLLEVGRRIGIRRLQDDSSTAAEGIGAVDGAVFALRLDVLPVDAQPGLRASLRRYLDTRIETYRKIPDMAAVRASLARGDELQREIWRQAVAAVSADSVPPTATMLVLPALNAMIDITTTRTMAAQMHPPPWSSRCCTDWRWRRPCWPATA